MIDRSYLPFQSAREYRDVNMQKWMGFFLSEHTTALTDDLNKVTLMRELSLEQKLFLLSQLYVHQLTARLTVLEGNHKKSYTGTIPTITQDHVLFKSTLGHLNLAMDRIISIELVEDTRYESA